MNACREYLAESVPCEWHPVSELPTLENGAPFSGKILLLTPGTAYTCGFPGVHEGRRLGGRLVYDDPRIEHDHRFPRAVAWCGLPPWPDFLDGAWPDDSRKDDCAEAR